MGDTSLIFNLLGRDGVTLALARIRAQVDRTATSVERIGKSDGLQSLSSGVDTAAMGLLRMGKAAFTVVSGMQAAHAAIGVAAALSGTLGLIPAAAVAGGVAIATLKVGLSGFGAVLKDEGDPKKFAADLKTLAPAAAATAVQIKALHPQLTTLKKDVQGRLFTGFAAQVKDLGAKYLPVLRTNLTGTAGGFNEAARATGSYLSNGRQVGLVATLLGQGRTAAGNLAKALQPAVSIVLNLASAGGSFLPQLTSGIGHAATAAATFVSNARATGQLHEWIATGLASVKQLGTVLGNVGSIVGSVFSKFSTAGAGVLPMLVRLTGQVKAFLNSAQGQQALGALASALAAISRVVSQVLMVALQQAAPIIVALAPVFAQLAQQVGAVLVQALQKAGPLLLSFAGWLAQNASWLGPLVIALAAGVKAFGLLAGAVKTTRNVVKGLKDVKDAADLLGKGIGKIGSFVGQGIGALGRLTGQAFAAAGRMAASAASTAASWVAAAARTTASLAVTAAQFVAQGARMVAVAAVTAARVVAGWVLMGVQSLIQAGRMAVAWLIAMGPIALVVAAVVGVVALIVTHWQQVKAVTVAVFTAVKNAISTAISFVINFVKAHWPLLVGILFGPLGVIVALVVTHWQQVKAVTVAVFTAVTAWIGARIQDVLHFFGFLGSLAGRVGAWFGGVRTAAVSRLTALVSWVAGLPGRILRALGNLGGLLVHAGASIVEGLWNGIKSLGGWLLSKITGWIRSMIPGPIASVLGIHSPSKVAADLAAQVPRGVAVGIDRTTGVAMAASRRMASRVRDGLGAIQPGVPVAAPGAAGGGAVRGTGRGGGGGSVATLRVLPGADQAVATMIMNLVRSGKLQLVVT